MREPGPRVRARRQYSSPGNASGAKVDPSPKVVVEPSLLYALTVRVRSSTRMTSREVQCALVVDIGGAIIRRENLNDDVRRDRWHLSLCGGKVARSFR